MSITRTCSDLAAWVAGLFTRIMQTTQDSRTARLSAMGLEVPRYSETRSGGWHTEAGLH